MAILDYPGPHVARMAVAGAAACGPALYELRNINGGSDAIDLSNDFQIINRAVIFTIVSDMEAAGAKITATQVAVPSGPSSDIGYLLVWGSPA